MITDPTMFSTSRRFCFVNQVGGPTSTTHTYLRTPSSLRSTSFSYLDTPVAGRRTIE